MKHEFIDGTTALHYPDIVIFTGGVNSYISITEPKSGAECILLAKVGSQYNEYRVRLKRTSTNGRDIIFPLSDVLTALWERARGKADLTSTNIDDRKCNLNINITYDGRITKSLSFILINGSPDRDVMMNRSISDRRRGVYWGNDEETLEIFAPTVSGESISQVHASWDIGNITSESTISNPFVSSPTTDIGTPPEGNAEIRLMLTGDTGSRAYGVPLYIDMCSLSERDMELKWFDELGVFCCWRFTEEYNETSVTTDAILTRMDVSIDSLYQSRTRMTRKQTTHTLHSRKVPRDVVPFIKSILYAPVVWRYNGMNETMIVEDYKEKDYGRGYVDVVIKVTDTPQSYE